MPGKTTSDRPKAARTPHIFGTVGNVVRTTTAYTLHFFDISTSKSGPGMVCFVHFELEMCFAPQWRALFWHHNFQKCSEPVIFLHFWLGNVLRATTGCTFLTSQLPKAVRTWGDFSFFASKCASRHNGEQFFISHLASWLRLSLLFFSSLTVLTSAFTSVHIVGSLTSKLPSNKMVIIITNTHIHIYIYIYI